MPGIVVYIAPASAAGTGPGGPREYRHGSTHRAPTVVNPYHDPALQHRGPEGFRNTSEPFELRSLADVLRWKWQAARRGEPRPPRAPIPCVAADLALLRQHAARGNTLGAAVTWIGHATVLTQSGGVAVLTDPMFSERASPSAHVGPRRHVPPGVALADLPHVDIVVVSHNHYDHLDLPSLHALARQPGGAPLVLVPLGLAPWLQARGVTNVVELDWWQSHTVQAAGHRVEVVLVPARHWSGRGLNDRMATLWGGFAVFFEDFHLFFAGDTGYSRDFAEVRRRFAARQRDLGFDLAVLPIGAYAPRWFMAPQHVDVDEALQIHRDLGCQRSLGVHWGTFALASEPLDEPPVLLAERRGAHGVADEAFFVQAIGETRVLPRRPPACPGGA